MEEVGAAIVQCVWDARKPGTIKQYCYALRKFFRFRLLGSKSLCLPIDALSACEYLSYLRQTGAARGAVSVAFNAMKWAHNFVPNINAVNDPLEGKMVKRVFESALRSASVARNVKAPLTAEIIEGIFDRLPKSPSLTELRDASIVVLAFNLLLRHDEVSHLCCSHLTRIGKNVKVRITSSKTDKLRNGAEMWLAGGRATELLERYMKAAGLGYGENRFLFGPVTSSGLGQRIENSILAYNSFRQILRKLLVAQGVDASLFGFHSCRSGGATALAPVATQFEIMTAGRWKDQRSLAHYVEVPQERRLQLSQSLDRQRE